MLVRLKNCLPGDQRDAPMVEMLERIEEKVREYQAFLSEFANRNSVSVEEMASALLREVGAGSRAWGLA